MPKDDPRALPIPTAWEAPIAGWLTSLAAGVADDELRAAAAAAA